MKTFTKIRHWLPLITFCPVNKLPDLLYITVEPIEGKFIELYSVRKKLRDYSFRTIFMEDLSKAIMKDFPDADAVTVRLLFSRHVVLTIRDQYEL